MRFAYCGYGRRPRPVAATAVGGEEAPIHRCPSMAPSVRDLPVASHASSLGGASARTPWRILKNEADPARYLPYARHINDHVIALDGRDLMMMFQLDGLAF